MKQILSSSSIVLGLLVSIEPSLAVPQTVNGLKKPVSEPILLNDSGDSMKQITSVSELRDVAPTEWAYEALRSLVERYGCIVGYPDRTFRGNKSLSRWEFAAGLNACLNVMERLIQEGGIGKEDIDKLKRLVQEFQGELAALGAKIDNLEGRVSFLENHQFSTTTKLNGQVVMAAYGVAAGQRDSGQPVDKVPAFGYRTRLELNTSFTGEDLLFTRLAAGNIPPLDATTGTPQSNLAFTQDDNSQLGLEVLYYKFPITPNINVWIEPVGGQADDFTNTLNFLDGDGAAGALSAFGTRNSLYYTVGGSGGSGLGLQGKFDDIQFSAGYFGSSASTPTQGNGLFNGPYGAIAQVGYVPNQNFALGLTYVNNYNQLDSGVGSTRANFQAFTQDILGEEVPTSNNAYGLEFTWHVTDKFVVGGWGGYTKSSILGTANDQINRGTLDIWNWAFTMAFPDFLKEGAVAGLIVGMQPWVSASNVILPNDLRNTDNNSSFHIEAFYQYPLTDNIAITPGIIVITSPNYNNQNSSLVIGTIRTTFSF